MMPFSSSAIRAMRSSYWSSIRLHRFIALASVRQGKAPACKRGAHARNQPTGKRTSSILQAYPRWQAQELARILPAANQDQAFQPADCLSARIAAGRSCARLYALCRRSRDGSADQAGGDDCKHDGSADGDPFKDRRVARVVLDPSKVSRHLAQVFLQLRVGHWEPTAGQRVEPKSTAKAAVPLILCESVHGGSSFNRMTKDHLGRLMRLQCSGMQVPNIAASIRCRRTYGPSAQRNTPHSRYP